MKSGVLLPSWSRTVASDWPWVRLDSVCSAIVDCPHSTPHYVDKSGYLCARTQDFSAGFLDVRSAGHVSKETFDERTSRAVPRYGDIIYSREGSIHGIAAEIPRGSSVCLGQRTVLIRPDPDLADHRFVLHWLNSRQVRSYVAGHKTGSAAPRINMPTIRALPVALPPMDEQRAIAQLLGTLDDKILLNRRMNTTLEEMARALFKSWFVDFDPVRAKMEGRPPYGMDGATAALFPDSFDGGVGPIPARWEVQRLSELTTHLKRGFGPKYVDEGGVCVLNQRCIRDSRVDFSKARRHDAERKTTVGRELAVGDVLVNSTGVGTLGRTAQLWRLPEQVMIVDSHVTVVRANRDLMEPTLLGLALALAEPTIEAMAEGTTGQTELSRLRLGGLSIVQAPKAIQIAAAGVLRPITERITLNDEEAEALASIRDVLLPKLLSGDIRLKDAERQVEAVA